MAQDGAVAMGEHVRVLREEGNLLKDEGCASNEGAGDPAGSYRRCSIRYDGCLTSHCIGSEKGIG